MNRSETRKNPMGSAPIPQLLWKNSIPPFFLAGKFSVQFCGLARKTIILFAISGGSGFGETLDNLAGSCPGALVKEGKVFSRRVSREALSARIETL